MEGKGEIGTREERSRRRTGREKGDNEERDGRWKQKENREGRTR